MSPLRKEQFLIRLLAVHTTAFFPPLYFYFNFLLKRRSLTSNVTPTATQNSVSPPRGTHHSTFYRLSTSILTSFLKRRSLTSKVTPTPIRHSDSPPRLTYGTIFCHFSTSILTFSWSGGALRRMSQLRKNQIPILLLALPILVFFAASLLYFNFLFRRWSLTFNVTPKPTLNSDSTPRVTHHSFFRLSTSILNFSWSSGALPPTSPYTHIRFGFPSTPYLHYDFYPPLYLHFKFFLKRGALPPTSPLQQQQIRIPLHALPTYDFSHLSTSNLTFFLKRRSLTSKVTPTLTSDSDSTSRFTHPTIFTHLSNSILTFSCSVGALPPTSPLRKYQFLIRLLAVPTTGNFPVSLPPNLSFSEAVEPYL